MNLKIKQRLIVLNMLLQNFLDFDGIQRSSERRHPRQNLLALGIEQKIISRQHLPADEPKADPHRDHKSQRRD